MRVLVLVALCGLACEVPPVEVESTLNRDAEPFGGADPAACGDASVPTLQVRVLSDQDVIACDAVVVARGGGLDAVLELSDEDCTYFTTELPPGSYSLEVSREGCATVNVPEIRAEASSCSQSPETGRLLVVLGPECVVPPRDAGRGDEDAGDAATEGAG